MRMKKTMVDLLMSYGIDILAEAANSESNQALLNLDLANDPESRLASSVAEICNGVVGSFMASQAKMEFRNTITEVVDEVEANHKELKEEIRKLKLDILLETQMMIDAAFAARDYRPNIDTIEGLQQKVRSFTLLKEDS